MARKFLPVIFLSVLLSGVAAAQLPTSGNVFFGYSYSQGQTFGPFGTHGVNMNGWDGSVQGQFLPWLAGIADFDWHYGGNNLFGCVGPACIPARFRLNGSRHAVLFGPRASYSIGKYTVFAEFLFGLTHQTDTGGGVSNSDTRFATAFGGGLDYKLVKGVAWRVDADSIRTRFFGNSENNLRLSTGIVFHF